MAIRYLYPIPAPVYVGPVLPEGFVLDEAAKAATQVAFEDFVLALGNHQIFTRTKGQEQWDAVLLSVDERKGRLVNFPDGEDYFALPGAALEILKSCLNDPMFYILVDNQPGWVRGLPWLPGAVRQLRPFIELVLKGAKDKKPEPVLG